MVGGGREQGFLSLKNKLIKKFEETLAPEEIELAKKDPHSRRRPRPCGFTLHVAKGCSGGCLYCYVKPPPVRNKLSPKALVYSLLLNPRFVPRKSFIAIGAVCEPLDFPDYTKELILELLQLGNPIQLSTKEINYDLANLLRKIDTLISMCAPDEEICKKFEPRRPSLSQRLEFCEAVKGGVFIRPILPMVPLEKYLKGIEKVVEYTDRIILGNLRLIGDVPKKLGIKNLSKKYYKRKRIIEEYIRREFDVIVFRSACCSNAYKHKVICWNRCWEKGFCVRCPNRCWIRASA